MQPSKLANPFFNPISAMLQPVSATSSVRPAAVTVRKQANPSDTTTDIQGKKWFLLLVSTEIKDFKNQ
jgi:hypothetical protein